MDAGLRAVAPSTVVDLSGPMPRVLRRGKGDWCAQCKSRNGDGAFRRLTRRAAHSEPWLIEGAEDVSSRPFVAKDGDDDGEDEDGSDVFGGGSMDGESAFADYQEERAPARRR